MWQFPNLLGAVDGKHIRIKAPINSGSLYFNYKKYFSIVLLAACDAKYRFTWVDIGQYGSVSDGGVWNNTDFAEALEKELVDIPPPKNLPNTNIITHYAFVGDEAFPLKLYMLRPYSKDNLTDAQRIFNYRLSRARRVIENAFGILTARWQILLNTICLNPENATAVVKALVCLHNFIMITDEEMNNAPDTRLYCPPNFVDNMDNENGEWRNIRRDNVVLADLTRLGSNNASRRATEQRNILKDYFLSPIGEAQAPWQYNRAFRGININLPE
ncbi:PREDICTED: putative nuclease HARBI1 [Vollenhovia emeryi]|uniref:putative nuclease HARBI1 n=1 Tax=Vollenhovia emeryi TaxID=411798 RepID=UPI0005F4A2A3|nr:PREDICTED: putative nuclease HARBI1 [Vollenhovia emeryi]